ncbi:MAG: hypothetical protein LBU84_15580 [Prevotella sp.]|jgi:ribosome maturation factor RimP|nr:hypothetical protein [Prevotella sp.]
MSVISKILDIISIPFQLIYGFLYFLFSLLIVNPIKKAAKFLLREELERENNKKESLRLSLQEKKEEIEDLGKIEKKYRYLVTYGCQLVNTKGLIYFEVTSKGDPVLISYDHYNDIMGEHVSLYLYKYEDHIYGANTQIYGQIHSLFDRDSKMRIKKHTIIDLKREECKCLYIHDFISSVKKEGYGSALLDFLFKICKGLKIDCIVGELAYIDRENFFYIIPFYKKKGFEIYLSEDGYEGAIIKYVQ